MSLYRDGQHLLTDFCSIWRQDGDTVLDPDRVSDFPKKMQLGICSKCNLHCWHCRKVATGSGNMMTEEMVDKVIEAFPKIRAVRLGGGDTGEQMLSPHFGRVLDECKKSRVSLEIVTNGVLINEDMAERMVASCAMIGISIEGMNERYEEIRYSPWSLFLRNLQLLVDARFRQGSHAQIWLWYTTMKDFRDDCFGILGLAAANRLVVGFRNFMPSCPEERGRSLLSDTALHDSHFSEVGALAAKLGVRVLVPPKIVGSSRQRKPCCLPFETMAIGADGRTGVCCCGSLNLGDISKAGIGEIWNNDAYRGFRVRCNSDVPSPCLNCETAIGRIM